MNLLPRYLPIQEIRLFDFVPVDLDELDIKSKFIVSFSTYVRQSGDDYGNDVKSSENVDLLEKFLLHL